MPFKPGQSGNPAGRAKGVPNKITLQREHELAASGLMPLDYMLSILRDESAPEKRRDWAAQQAAPYCHARLSQVDANHSGELDVREWLLRLGDPDEPAT